MKPRYCIRCGTPTEAFGPNPEFCGNCGNPIVSTAAAPASASAPPKDEETAAMPPYNPYPDLDAGVTMGDAIRAVVARHHLAERVLPFNVGVIIQMDAVVEATLPMHRQNMAAALSDPSAEKLPYNLMANPFAEKPELWRDCKGRLISRAAAIAYYWGGASYGRRWHFQEPLSQTEEDRLVTVDERYIDFELRFQPDVQDDYDIVWKALGKLEELLDTGVNTKSRRIVSVGEAVSWAVFGMDELDPKCRRTA